MTNPAPGWHPDPEGNQQLRYWDGQQWTSATQPMPAPQTPTPETPKQAKDRKRQLIAIGIVVAAVASIAIFKSIDSSSDDTETAAAETTTTTPTSTNQVKDDMLAARAACDKAIVAKWNIQFDPSIFAFKTSGSGNSYQTTGAVDSSDGPDKVRYEFTCTTTKANGEFTSAVTDSKIVPTLAAPPTTPAATTTRPPINQPTPAATATEAGCEEPDSGIVDAIANSLTEGREIREIAAVTTMVGKIEYTYTAGNVYNPDGTRSTSGVVWITPGFGVMGLSGNSRNVSDLPFGRGIVEANAGDEYGTKVQDCVTSLALGR